MQEDSKNFSWAGLVRTPIKEFNSNEIAAAATACFEGYVIPIKLTAASFHWRFSPEAIDWEASSIYSQGDERVAITLIARRGWTDHLSALAIAPVFRGKGLGRTIMGEVLENSAKQGAKTMVLEAIEGNDPAIKLYESLGFRFTRRLVGGLKAALDVQGERVVREFDLLEVCRLLAFYGEDDRPWLLSPYSLAAKGSPAIGLQLGDHCFAIVETTAGEAVFLWAIFVADGHQGEGLAGEMVRQVQLRFPGKSVRALPFFPEEEFVSYFQPLGFDQGPLKQVEMRFEY